MTTNHHTGYPTSQELTATNQNAPLSQLDQAILDRSFQEETIVTIAAGVAALATLTGKSGSGNRNIIVAAQSGNSDDLAEVTGLTVGDMISLFSDTGDTITVKHNDGGATVKFRNIVSGDVTLSNVKPILYQLVSSNNLSQINHDANFGGTSASIAILTDEKTTGTQGGSSSTNTWNARDLNTEQDDPDGIVTIASDEFTPIAGDYRLSAYAPALNTNGHRLRLFNVTGAAVVQEGATLYNAVASSANAQLDVRFTANGTDAYRIDHWTELAVATTGLGRRANDGSPEIYLVIVLEKE